MTTSEHLWAVGYDDMEQANQVRDAIIRLGWVNDYLLLKDVDGTTPDKDGVRVLYKRLRAAFPDFRPEIHWQAAAGNLVTTYKTYHGTHQGEFLGIPATGKQVSFYTVDAMRVVNGKITEHWGVATLLDLMQQLGVVLPLERQR